MRDQTLNKTVGIKQMFPYRGFDSETCFCEDIA